MSFADNSATKIRCAWCYALLRSGGLRSGVLKPGAEPYFLAAGVTLDLLLGDPEYRAHPVRLMGWTLTRTENLLRGAGLDGYGGGIALFLILCVVWVGGVSLAIGFLPEAAAAALSIFLIYSLLALRDLLRHGWNVERAAVRGDLPAAHAAISKLVGRDTAGMDAPACVRAAIESLTENLTDGFVSPVFWYALGGLPCLVLFKVVSTMDSMVGYKSERYLRFGWCGARSDDLMNWIPARITWLLVTAVAASSSRVFGEQESEARMAAACDRAGTELRLERGGRGGRHPAAPDRPDLGRRQPGDRGLAG